MKTDRRRFRPWWIVFTLVIVVFGVVLWYLLGPELSFPHVSADYEVAISAHAHLPLELSSDGKTLTVGCRHDSVLIWDVSMRRQLNVLAQDATPLSACFSPDNKYLAVGTDSGKVLIWDHENAARVDEIVLPRITKVMSLSFSPDGSLLGVAANEAGILIYNCRAKKMIFEMSDDSIVVEILFSSQPRQIVYSTSTRIFALDWVTGKTKYTIDRFVPYTPPGCRTYGFVGNGTVLACLRVAHVVELYDSSTGRLTARLDPPYESRIARLPDTGLCVAQDRYVCVGGLNQHFYWWDTDMRRLVSSHRMTAHFLRTGASSEVAAALREGRVYIYRMSSFLK